MHLVEWEMSIPAVQGVIGSALTIVGLLIEVLLLML